MFLAFISQEEFTGKVTEVKHLPAGMQSPVSEAATEGAFPGRQDHISRPGAVGNAVSSYRELWKPFQSASAFLGHKKMGRVSAAEKGTANGGASVRFGLRLSRVPIDEGLLWLYFCDTNLGGKKEDVYTAGDSPRPAGPASDVLGGETAKQPFEGTGRAVKIRHALSGMYLKLGDRGAQKRVPEHQIAALTSVAKKRRVFRKATLEKTASTRTEGGQSRLGEATGYQSGMTGGTTGALQDDVAALVELNCRSRAQVRGLVGTPDISEASMFILLQDEELRQRAVGCGDGPSGVKKGRS